MNGEKPIVRRDDVLEAVVEPDDFEPAAPRERCSTPTSNATAALGFELGLPWKNGDVLNDWSAVGP